MKKYQTKSFNDKILTENWTITVPAWNERQGYDADGTPSLTLEQRAVALASCLKCGSHEDAVNHCRELARVLVSDAAREEVTREAARRLERPFNPDWSQLEAANESLREHKAMVRAAQESEQRFRARVAAALAKLREEFQQREGEGASDLWRAAFWTAGSYLGTTIAALLGDGTESCRWTLDGEDDGIYDTGCGGRFQIETGTPASNKMAFCCYCGKRIEEDMQ